MRSASLKQFSAGATLFPLGPYCPVSTAFTPRAILGDAGTAPHTSVICSGCPRTRRGSTCPPVFPAENLTVRIAYWFGARSAGRPPSFCAVLPMGVDFPAELVALWEQAASGIDAKRIRHASVRIGVVLGAVERASTLGRRRASR